MILFKYFCKVTGLRKGKCLHSNGISYHIHQGISPERFNINWQKLHRIKGNLIWFMHIYPSISNSKVLGVYFRNISFHKIVLKTWLWGIYFFQCRGFLHRHFVNMLGRYWVILQRTWNELFMRRGKVLRQPQLQRPRTM